MMILIYKYMILYETFFKDKTCVVWLRLMEGSHEMEKSFSLVNKATI